MKQTPRLPGFEAAVALARHTTAHYRHNGKSRYVSVDSQNVLPQAARGCGFAFAVALLGAAGSNPAVFAAGLAAIAAEC
jgi:hypothetical protein